MTLLQDTAHAKINLYLHVTGRRPDGYHLLDSLAVFAGAADEVRIAEKSDRFSLSIEGRFGAGLEADDSNLVLRAARALQAHAGKNDTYHLTLEKNLPVASGIGGGSADAACTLRLLGELWNIDEADLIAIAEPLGADVPVCVQQKPNRMEGIGEILTAVPAMPDGGILLINPGLAVSTPDIFRSFAAMGGIIERSAPVFPARWTSMSDLVEMLSLTANDLQAPAIRHAPSIGKVLDTLDMQKECLMARMSGSGATCFGLFPTPDAARNAEIELSKEAAHLGWWTWAGPFLQN
ncbi:4-(cytidine 5'-diphospho)-2-C-methyl-D-erythritol kinase [Gluconobacter thailandicus]|uniref:4-diphosphocytidyl-2-C-methyl-D-erythritol kinase n=1 Tax=Gluconobacter thailandicus TaxID=257438 RepID=A0AAP9EST8_GLUTH|nr:4-(cytidine 5'-diphospho)-2-C-methyl-D-erythritol kinase [Gluconobacter thailandicus]QEH96255.1 4-(cytidine 5'-diphospho)-2-C-methyl-D-erythritol kinase [Gluconobacter thailandicus]